MRIIYIISKDRDLTDYKKLPNDMLRSCGMESKTSLVFMGVHEFYHGMFRNGNGFLVSIFYLIERIVEITDLYVRYSIHYLHEVKYN